MTDKIDAALELLTQKARSAGTKTSAERVERIDNVVSGVTATWLASAFRMDRSAVLRKLAQCPVIRVQGDKRNSKLYDLAVAARYLVPPILSPEDFLRSLHKSDLPTSLQESVWNALLKRQTWERNAGQLWATEDVWRVLAGMFQSIKFVTQLWADTVANEEGLSEAQRHILERLTRGLLQEIYDKIVENARTGSTEAQIASIRELLGDDPLLDMHPGDFTAAGGEDDDVDHADLI